MLKYALSKNTFALTLLFLSTPLMQACAPAVTVRKPASEFPKEARGGVIVQASRPIYQQLIVLPLNGHTCVDVRAADSADGQKAIQCRLEISPLLPVGGRLVSVFPSSHFDARISPSLSNDMINVTISSSIESPEGLRLLLNGSTLYLKANYQGHDLTSW